MERMTKEQLDDDFLGLDLMSQPTQAGFVFVRRGADGQLLAEFLGQFLFQPEGGLVVDFPVAVEQAHRRPQLLGRRTVHPDQQPAAVTVTAGPAFDELVKLLPAPQVEVADAEIGPIRDFQGLPQGRQKQLLDVVEDAGHAAFPHDEQIGICLGVLLKFRPLYQGKWQKERMAEADEPNHVAVVCWRIGRNRSLTGCPELNKIIATY
jgi:hypothetical protein